MILLRGKILTLSEELELKKDVESQLVESEQRGRDNQLAREGLIRELEKATELNEDLEQKLYNNNDTSL